MEVNGKSALTLNSGNGANGNDSKAFASNLLHDVHFPIMRSTVRRPWVIQ